VTGSRRLSPTALWALGLFAAYFASRLAALTTLPIFFDETGHIRWAVWISQGQRMEKPWQYGKGIPIFANALLFPWAADHYLWASRALTVLFGAGTMAGAILLGRALAGARAGWLAGLFYVVLPYALVYDRLVLTDAAQGTFAAFVAVLSLRLVERWRVRDGLLLAVALALCVFSKALGVLLVFAPAAAVLLLAPRRLLRPLPLVAAYVATAALIAYPLMRYLQVTATVRVAVAKSDAGLWERLASNLPLAATWLRGYWTDGLIALALAALVHALVTRGRAALFVALLVAVPIVALAAVGDIWFPRYLVFLAAPFVALAARGAEALLSTIERRGTGARASALAGLVLLLFPALRFDLQLLRDPARAGLVEEDRFQYVMGWPSGYGVRETIEFVRAERDRHPDGITVVTHSRTVRTTARALDLEFAYPRGVRVEDLNFDRLDGAMPLLVEWSRERPTLVVIEPPQGKSRRPDPSVFADLRGEVVARTYKPDGSLCDEIYRLCGGQRCPPLEGSGPAGRLERGLGGGQRPRLVRARLRARRVAVDLAPEADEVVEPGHDGQDHDHPERGHGRHVQEGQARVAPQEKEEDGHDLGHHLRLAQAGGGDEVAPARGHVAQPGHGDLAADHDHHHPGRHRVHLDQGQERGRGEQLVRDGVEEDAELRDLVAAPREVAVQVVGEDGDAEDRGAEEQPLRRARAREEHDHEHGHEEDAEDGEGVGEVHPEDLRS
jgi:hypothetical protein